MDTQHKRLLSEEEIDRMLDFKGHQDDSLERSSQFWLWENRRDIFFEAFNRKCLMPYAGMPLLLAFLRGQTRRVLNLDRLREDIRAWMDDLDRKLPEWMMDGDPMVFGGGIHFQSEINGYYQPPVSLDWDYPCTFAATIGINPDDYFEEQIIEEVGNEQV